MSRARTLAGIAVMSVALLAPAGVGAEEAAPPTTSELDKALPGDAPDVLEDNGDDSSNAGLWGLLGLLGLGGLAGLMGRRRTPDTGVAARPDR